MIVDASVWVSRFAASDVHHLKSNAWLSEQGRRGVAIVVPTLALAEVAGALARRTGLADLGRWAARTVVSRPRIRLVSLDYALASEAAELAATQRLRGADAVYLAVAARLGLPVVTWDLEMMHRAPAGVQVQTP